MTTKLLIDSFQKLLTSGAVVAMINLDDLRDQDVSSYEGNEIIIFWEQLKHIERRFKHFMALVKGSAIKHIQDAGEEVTESTRRVRNVDCQQRRYVKIDDTTLNIIMKEKGISKEDVFDVVYKVSEEKLEELIASGVLTEEDIGKCTTVTTTSVLKMRTRK
jgi:hypothetical protein